MIQTSANTEKFNSLGQLESMRPMPVGGARPTPLTIAGVSQGPV